MCIHLLLCNYPSIDLRALSIDVLLYLFWEPANCCLLEMACGKECVWEYTRRISERDAVCHNHLHSYIGTGCSYSENIVNLTHLHTSTWGRWVETRLSRREFEQST